ncbi:pseudouridine synthase [Neptunomonas antarctica]|uniref:tRNA pseudouridine32 synthase / 23S rRNA pseudouridine746 synthase n=1 Tax=Neptunomonas antarctica TaxID=619304 RepID=A0A1N7KAF8_9GAMM|nr:pseudouridine synthase [Neptunomonas antarctica]SIS58533.1 tRNA pseudouridine32 synthase / 23S rRNA pseudouridine746 synthase [Neptunomonas antarctica]
MTVVVDTFVAPVCHEQIEILYQDEHILLINKPSGLLSLSGKNPLNKDSVHFRLVQEFPTATMAHRLDFGTSGIMVLALSKSVNAHLTKQFQGRAVVKTYLSVLDGHLECDQGTIDAPIAKDPPNFPLQKICYHSGKQALSDYKVLSRSFDPLRCRVLFSPQTGRTHQLRIHSREVGHSILGCDLYGTERTQGMANRLLLHAFTLEFEHPITGEKVMGRCACPF